jgi:hypothetical protein
MFQGSIPASGLKVMANVIKDWKCEKIYVGCSGNFTVERCISKFFEGTILSNDVTIYSANLGKYFAGEELVDFEVREDYEGYCQYFRDYMNTDTEKMATMILATDILPYEKKNIPYFKRMLKAYEEQWPEMHKTMCIKLENIETKIENFYYGDVMNMLDEIDEDTGFVSFPPFFKGGYEKMWKDLETTFTYEPPSYVEFDPDKHIAIFCEKVKKAKNFIIGTERIVPELQEFYSGMALTAKNKPIYFYSRTDKRVFIRPLTKHSLLKVERIKKNDKINNVEIKKLSHEQFDELRAVYLSKMITPARESAAFGLFTDNKLFGVFAFSTSMTLVNSFENMISGPTIYLMTDFAISPTSETHLSKLVLNCILSKEVKQIAENLMNKRVRSVCTNAFSKNPISMKYRSVFEQLNRREMDVDKATGKVTKYNLTYGALMGQWTLQEGYEKWKQKS